MTLASYGQLSFNRWNDSEFSRVWCASNSLISDNYGKKTETVC